MDEFRFLVICELPTDEDGYVSLQGVLNDIRVARLPVEITMSAVVGAVLRDPMWGKRLDLMAWRFGKTGERQPIPGYAGTPLFLPREGVGAAVLPYPITVPIPERGIYGFELFDREGAFGTAERLLATYLYSVEETN